MAEKLAQVPKEVAGAVNLMAHPMAGFAAASAIGLGLASHAFGIWMGAVAGAWEAAERMAAPKGRQTAPASTAELRARIAARALIDDAQSFAREVSGTRAATVTRLAPRPRAKARAQEPAPQAAAARPAAMRKPARPDDLKAISGIGPKLEQVLNRMGIWTYGQIAAWTPAEAAWVDDQLGFAGRIGRDDWIGQAAKLAAGAKG